MTGKVCTFDGCPPNNVKRETTTVCSICNVMVHLPCIGITAKSDQIQSPNIRILCHKCMDEPTPLIDLTDAKSTPKKVTIAAIMNEVKLLRQCIETQAKDMQEIKAGLANKPAEKPAEKHEPELLSFHTPKTNKKNTATKAPIFSFAGALRNGLQQPSAKRMRTEKSSAVNATPKMKFSAPKPKVGTKVSANGGKTLTAAPKREPKPKLTKSVWVGGLEKYTTEDDIIEYIIENTPIENVSQVKVHSLLKKDKDVSKLNFVSFKVDVSEEHFDALMNADIWPVDTEVREFINRNKTLGDFFPALNKQNEQKNGINPTESMDTSEMQQQMKSPVQPPNQMPSATASQTQSPSKQN